MSERTEWPTSAQLQDLREQGLVPYSAFSTACMGTTALILTLYIMRERMHSLLKVARSFCAEKQFEVIPLLDAIQNDLLALLLVPLLSVLVTRWIWSLLQTRFLMAFARIGFRLQFGIRAGEKVWRRMIRYLLLTATGTCIVLLVFRYLIHDVFVLLNNDRRYLLLWPRHFLEKVLPLLVGLLICAGLLSWLWNRIAFMIEHRTTRGELYRDFEG